MSFLTNIFGPKKEEKVTKAEQLSAQCPYCGHDIIPVPTRRKKCPNCDMGIIVRTHYETKMKLLLTEAQVDKFDIDKEKYYAVTSFLRGLEQTGIPSGVVDSLVTKQTKVLCEKFNTEPSFADVAWGVSNQLITDYHEAANGIHFQQARFLHREGKDPTKIRLVGFKEDLMRYKESDVVNKVEVLTAGEESCEGCKKLANKIFTIQEALEKNILPCKECSFKRNSNDIGWCRCCYAPHLDYD
jgi:hypothetical protein